MVFLRRFRLLFYLFVFALEALSNIVKRGDTGLRLVAELTWLCVCGLVLIVMAVSGRVTTVH